MKANLKVACAFFGLAVGLVALRSALVGHIMAAAVAHNGFGALLHDENKVWTGSLFPELWGLSWLSCAAGAVALCWQIPLLDRDRVKECFYFLGSIAFGLVAVPALGCLWGLSFAGFYGALFNPREAVIAWLMTFAPYFIFQFARLIIRSRTKGANRVEAASGTAGE